MGKGNNARKWEGKYGKGGLIDIGATTKVVESLDYRSASGAKAWIKKQTNAESLQVLHAPDGRFYAVSNYKSGAAPSSKEGVWTVSNNDRTVQFRRLGERTVPDATLVTKIRSWERKNGFWQSDATGRVSDHKWQTRLDVLYELSVGYDVPEIVLRQVGRNLKLEL